MHFNTPFYWTAVVLVIVIASARITRLATFDHFPPVAWVREKYKSRTLDHGDWYLLAICGYCFSFWGTALVVGLGELAGVFDNEPVVYWFTPVWWFVMGTLAASYVAAVFVSHDGDESEAGV